MKNMKLYWIEAKLCDKFGKLKTVENIREHILCVMSVIKRSKGEIFCMFSNYWKVTDCYLA